MGPRTVRQRSEAASSRWMRAWPVVRPPARSNRSPSCFRVIGPSAHGAWIVLAPDQVKVPAVHPGDHQRAVDRKRTVGIGSGEPCAPRADGSSNAAGVLTLNRQQSFDDSHRVAGRWTGKQLGTEASLIHHFPTLPSVETKVDLRIRGIGAPRRVDGESVYQPD